MKSGGGVDAAPLVEGGRPAPSLAALVRRALVALDKVSAGVVIAAIGVMVVLVSGQVFCRYFLNFSIDWADEISRLSFVWAVLLALPHGVKQGVHVGIDILVKRFNPRAQEILTRAMCGLSALLMVAVLQQAIIVAGDSWEELMPTVEMTVSVFYIAVVIAAAHAMVHLLFLTWQGTDAWQEDS